jgi:hypothetical protein
MNGDASLPITPAVSGLGAPQLDVCNACQEDVPVPARPINRPGLGAVAYRIGTHGSFRRRMLARLPTEKLPLPDDRPPTPGAPPATDTADRFTYPLAALTTRADDDAAIALVDAWATVADVLTFYQERIANEGYLLTATERRSVLELARAIGYELNPGVAATAFLAFTVEDAAGAPRRAVVDERIKVLSIPGQNEKPQTFETVERIEALATLNALRPQLTTPQVFAVGATEVYVRGMAAQVQAGDAILLCGAERETWSGSERWDLRIVQTVEVVPPAPDGSREGYTRLTWQPGLGQASGPTVAPATSGVKLFVFRQRAALFGHNAPDFRALPDVTKAAYDPEIARDLEGQRPIDRRRTQWPDFEIQNTERAEIDLDAVYPRVLVGSMVVLSRPGYTELYRVVQAETASRTDYTLSAKVTRLTLDTREHLTFFGLRDTVVFVQSDPLGLAERPVTVALGGGDASARITLAGPAPDLRAGQALAVSGKPPGAAASDPAVGEVVFVQSLDESKQRTTITLTAPLQLAYDPATVTINANVARATHGETVRDEVLGSGAGGLANQRFALKKPPLTYVSAPTPSGAQSTLEVRVDDVRWDETPSLFGLQARDRRYTVRLEHDGVTRVVFGDGVMGARLPTGVENVRATYRSGIGPDGNVDADKVSLLLTRPLGVRGVTNPTPTSGGTAPEGLGDARANAPLTVLTLDRIVSLRDFEDFARAFAGIGKAQAVRLWNGRADLVNVTVAGNDGAAAEAVPTLLDNLRRAMDGARDPVQQLRVEGFDPLRFGLQAEILVDPLYLSDDVLAAAAAALGQAFTFVRRGFGQPVTAAEVITVLQGVPGVRAVDLNDLFVVPGAAPPGAPAPSTTPEAPAPPVTPLPPAFLEARPARVERGLILRAQLLLLDPDAVTLTQMRLKA